MIARLRERRQNRHRESVLALWQLGYRPDFQYAGLRAWLGADAMQQQSDRSLELHERDYELQAWNRVGGATSIRPSWCA
jgi:hypothetical protein